MESEPMAESLLDVIDLEKRYGSTTALDGVSFRIAEGEMFGLLGPNGAGKTTLLSIVACLLEPTSGEARIFGRRVGIRDRLIRRELGIVPQELAIYGELTARENLTFFGNLYGLTETAVKQRVAEVLQSMGLADRADQRVDSFSGGMKRRLNMGAALIHRPRLLLLDEPTSGVDPQSRNHLFEEIRRLNQSGVTIVYTSQYIEEVQATCRRIGIIDHGRLVACDTLDGLLQRIDTRIRFQVSEVHATLYERLRALPDAELSQAHGRNLELKCRNVKLTLAQLIVLLNELQAELVSLEVVEPSLERVFLQLTGDHLRD